LRPPDEVLRPRETPLFDRFEERSVRLPLRLRVRKRFARGPAGALYRWIMRR